MAECTGKLVLAAAGSACFCSSCTSMLARGWPLPHAPPALRVLLSRCELLHLLCFHMKGDERPTAFLHVRQTGGPTFS